MSMPEDLENTLQQLADVLQTQRTLGVALAGLAEAATVSVPGCDAATIAISIGGRPATAATTGTVALELDMAQYDAEIVAPYRALVGRCAARIVRRHVPTLTGRYRLSSRAPRACARRPRRRPPR